jgi:hypothetical protein
MELFYIGIEYLVNGDRDSVVGVKTFYGLDGSGIESRWGQDFQHPSGTSLGPPSLQYNGYRVIPRGKSAGTWLESSTIF